jgi:hypothetical protein
VKTIELLEKENAQLKLELNNLRSTIVELKRKALEIDKNYPSSGGYPCGSNVCGQLLDVIEAVPTIQNEPVKDKLIQCRKCNHFEKTRGEWPCYDTEATMDGKCKSFKILHIFGKLSVTK